MSSSLRIMFFLDYGISYGGAVNTLVQQAYLMKLQGNEVKVLISDYFDNNLEYTYIEKLNRLNIGYEKATYQISSQPEDIDVVCLTENYEIMRSKILEYHPDILHSVQINPLVELVSRDLEIPHIMNIYPLLPEFFDLPYPDIFPHYHICDSIYWAKKWNVYLKTEYCCIRTLAEKQKRDTASKRNGEFIKFICVGDIYEDKNQLNVIKGFEKAVNQGVKGKLHLYGHENTAYAEDCRRYIIKHKLNNYVEIKGFHNNLDDLYGEYDALICGSTRESYPNAISEAYANDLVIISTPVGGVPEIVRDRENGYLCEDYSFQGIYEKILSYDNDRRSGRIDKITQAAKKTYSAVHAPEAVAHKLKAFYCHVITDKRPSTDVNLAYIQKMFAEEIHIYRENENKLLDKKRVAEKLWYIHFVKGEIEKKMEEKASFYIWGVGKMLIAVKEILKIYFPQIRLKGYIDSHATGLKDGLPIYKPQEIITIKHNAILIAAKNGQSKIIEDLNRAGKHYNKDYFIFTERRW